MDMQTLPDRLSQASPAPKKAKSKMSRAMLALSTELQGFYSGAKYLQMRSLKRDTEIVSYQQERDFLRDKVNEHWVENGMVDFLVLLYFVFTGLLSC